MGFLWQPSSYYNNVYFVMISLPKKNISGRSINIFMPAQRHNTMKTTLKMRVFYYKMILSDFTFRLSSYYGNKYTVNEICIPKNIVNDYTYTGRGHIWFTYTTKENFFSRKVLGQSLFQPANVTLRWKIKNFILESTLEQALLKLSVSYYSKKYKVSWSMTFQKQFQTDFTFRAVVILLLKRLCKSWELCLRYVLLEFRLLSMSYYFKNYTVKEIFKITPICSMTEFQKRKVVFGHSLMFAHESLNDAYTYTDSNDDE